jgi:hypothetical protein
MHSTDSPEADQYVSSRYRYRYRRQWDDDAVLDDDVIQTPSSPIKVVEDPIPDVSSDISTEPSTRDEPDEEVTVACVRLRPRSVRNCTSITLNVNPASPIAEEVSDDCRSECAPRPVVQAPTTPSPSPSICSSSFYLRKSDTVFELQPAEVGLTVDDSSSQTSNEPEEDESSSVSYNFTRLPCRSPSPSNQPAVQVRLRLRPTSQGDQRQSDASNTSHETTDSDVSLLTSNPSSDFIGQYKDIDEMLGNLFRMIEDTNQTLDDDYSGFQEVHASSVKVHDNQALVAKVRLSLSLSLSQFIVRLPVEEAEVVE